MSLPSQDPFLSGDYLPTVDPKTIIIADDDPSLVNLLRENFETMGHHVLCAFDGQMAIRLARQHRPNLIILDINMPMTNGFKTFEFLRASPETTRIPIIFVSGERSVDIYPKVSDAPRVAHVKKPFDLDTFNSLVQQFLSQYPVAR